MKSYLVKKYNTLYLFDFTLKLRVLFFIKSSDNIFGLLPDLTSIVYIYFPSKFDFILQVKDKQPLCSIKKSEIEPFFNKIYSGWQIFRETC